MMATRWFVQTRGVPREMDYSWMAVPNGSDDQAEDDDALEVRLGDELDTVRTHAWGGRTLDQLIGDDEQETLVLAHDPGIGTAALITGLVAAQPQPRDVLGRAIRVSLLGSVAPGEDVRDLVRMVVAALLGRLSGRLPITYDQPDEPGFAIDDAAWQRLVEAPGLDEEAPCGARPFSEGPASEGPASEGSIGSRAEVFPDDEDGRNQVVTRLLPLLAPGRPARTLTSRRVYVLRRPALDRREYTAIRPQLALTDVEGDLPDTQNLLISAASAALGVGRRLLPRPFLLIVVVVALAAAVALWAAPPDSTPQDHPSTPPSAPPVDQPPPRGAGDVHDDWRRTR